jgi:hypothetical protein
MTYRQHIQNEIERLDKTYDMAGALRDHATGAEKVAWNKVRGLTGEAASALRNLDNSLSKERANEEL